MKGSNYGRVRFGKLALFVAATAFVPPVGILFGAILAVWGANTPKRGGSLLVALGALGIAVSVFVTIHFTGRHDVFRLDYYTSLFREQSEDLIFEITEASLDSLVLDIEFYRVQHGFYPADLADLGRWDGSRMTFELIDPRTVGLGRRARPFFYQRVGDDHYYLLSPGPDGLPFSEDDMVPDIDILPGSRAGLLTARR